MNNNSIEEIKHERCPRCRCYRPDVSFLNKTGRRIKTCVKCRNLERKYRDKKMKARNKTEKNKIEF